MRGLCILLGIIGMVLSTFALSDANAQKQPASDSKNAWPFSFTPPKGFKLQKQLKLEGRDVWVLVGETRYPSPERIKSATCAVTDTIFIVRGKEFPAKGEDSEAAGLAYSAAETAAGLEMGASKPVDVRPCKIVDSTSKGIIGFMALGQWVEFGKEGEWCKKVCGFGGIALKQDDMLIFVAGAMLARNYDHGPIDEAIVEVCEGLRKQYGATKK